MRYILNTETKKTHGMINPRVFAILSINAVFGVLLLLVARSNTDPGNVLNYIVAIGILVTDLFFYLKSNTNQKVEVLIIVTWELTIIVELIYRIVRFDRTPFRILYISDIMCLIFLIEMICKGKIKTQIRNNILIIALLIIGSISSLINLRDPFDYVHGLMLVLRPWGLFLLTSTTQMRMPKWSKHIYGLSIVAFLLETLGRYNVDFRNGIFGYEYIGGLFQLVLVVWLSKAVVANFRRNRDKFLWIKIGAVELIFALREAKMECILLVVWLLILTVISRKKNNVKSVLYPILILIVGVVGWNLIPIISPKWAYVFQNWSFADIAYGGLTRMFYDSQTMPLQSFLKEENFSAFNYLFGVGFGAAQPPAYYRFIYLAISGLTGFPSSIWLSSLITKYYYSFSESLVFYRGIYDLIIDMGYFGLTVFVVIAGNYLYKSVKLCQCKNEYSNVIGTVGVWAVLYMAYRMMQYNILVVPLAMMVYGLLLGMIEYQYRQEFKTKHKIEL